MPKAAPKRKAANGYKLAEPLPAGEILEDVAKKKWKLGPSIGQGGFGEIYSAQEAEASGNKYPYVIKIEPHGNGPLFVEMHFYIKNAKAEDVEEFKKQRGLKTFGMPIYLGSGSHEFNGEKYRFIVMEKFGTDLWQIFLQHKKQFPATTVFKIAVQIVDVLEYIHSKGYVHADVKGANILMGTAKDTINKQLYLVDFGLAAKCNEEEAFKPNPKKAHDGTIEYLSRDAHNGVQTKRGDLETLAYNLIQWLGCVLPWEKDLKDPSGVQKSKEEYMSSIFRFIKACFDKRSPPGPIVDFLNYLSTLSHNSNPDYKNIRKLFLSGLDAGDALGKPLQFTMPEKSPQKKSPVKRKNAGVPKSSPKKKSKKQVEKREPEDEKENFEDEDISDSDHEEEEASLVTVRKKKEPKATKKPDNKKRPAKTTKAIAKSTAENEDGDTESDNEHEINENGKNNADNNQISTAIEADSIEDAPVKGKKVTSKKMKSSKGTKRIQAEESEEKNRKEDIEPEREPSLRTRQRGRAINYKEDSDDERKPSRKKAKVPPPSKDLQLHVTGDTMDGYTDAMKKVAKNKLQNDQSKKRNAKESKVAEENEEPSASNSSKTEEEVPKPSTARKNRGAKHDEDD